MTFKSREVTAMCVWYWRDPVSLEWVEQSGGATPCRASLAEKKLTIWLPQGAVIRRGLGRFVRGDQPEAMNGEYVYYYGLHGANDRKIKITLKPEPLEREFAKQ